MHSSVHARTPGVHRALHLSARGSNWAASAQPGSPLAVAVHFALMSAGGVRPGGKDIWPGRNPKSEREASRSIANRS